MIEKQLKKPLEQDKAYSLSVCILASGSKGNAIYISDGSTSILIDAGLSGSEIKRRLQSRGLRPEDLDAILVSHEHSDHIKGAGPISRRFDLPVYISLKTRAVASSQIGNINDIRYFKCGSTFMINSLTLHPFSLSHDAEDPAGFTVKKNGAKIGIATDLGLATSMVKEHLKDCTVLIIEANHDTSMLAKGPYPWPIKQRIKSRTGHLSNQASKNLLKEVQHNQLQHVILAHLSEVNNTPQKALSAVGQAITHSHTHLTAANQDFSGNLLYLK
ncbi:MAG: MBL fold metallo-hydrolase [Deltaproteobacteria bacterium CG1_02_45_11]|nr:MAG: MBL fold metallo-hydrolase [Deltaproteobacteria bacterium CG1_02_45_11]